MAISIIMRRVKETKEMRVLGKEMTKKETLKEK